ncbi:MAG TPA: Flp family type IVb pilin [Caulobacteraceae bacterium]|nr:Flp family type IVb pilin [Caulobacteraceae bacterium]
MGEAEQTRGLPDAASRRAAGGLVARPHLRSFTANVSGATAVEYGLIVSLIFLVILSSVTAFGSKATNMYNTISSTVGSAM